MKPAISSLQTVSLINNAITPTAVLAIPGVMIGQAHNDAWISGILAGVASVVIAALIAMICKANPGLPFVVWMENRFGRPIGMVIGILSCLYYFNAFCMIVRQFANFMGDLVLDETPLIMLVGIMVAVTAFTVAHGIEAIARSSFVVLLLLTIVIPFSIAINFGDMNVNRLLPLLDADPISIVSASITPFGWLSEVSILFILSPYIKKPASLVRLSVIGVLSSAALVILVTVMAISIFGPRLVPMMSYPFFNMVGIVEVGKFLERIEIFTVSVWCMTMYIKMAVFLFASVQCLSHALHTHTSRHVLIGISMLAVVTAVAAWPRNAEIGFLGSIGAVPFLFLFNIGMPIAIGLGLLVTKNGQSKKGAPAP
ncbi:GerAB/ArcD/ProY family transporter [Paenibacillus sp. MMS18-CY102]|uniref:GerAB/ArcD/ProY family transporter n=1 Tax=Paenibacillus sp. MMS18-CY102 TaxID=2682849 RepID=UPI0013653F4B|nr:endospore germination permease [Paenibacillus sp. MMS18-CY102]MWC30559.1 endospore germination permease [Paenibacillus sp. MMS18-CY102]